MLLRKLFGRKDKKKEEEALQAGLEKTRTKFFTKIRNVLGLGRKFDEDTRDELEALLITADVGVETTGKILDHLDEQDRFRKQFSNAFGNVAFDAMQEQARNNLVMFEKALGMFSPFPQQAENGEVLNADAE